MFCGIPLVCKDHKSTIWITFYLDLDLIHGQVFYNMICVRRVFVCRNAYNGKLKNIDNMQAFWKSIICLLNTSNLYTSYYLKRHKAPSALPSNFNIKILQKMEDKLFNKFSWTSCNKNFTSKVLLNRHLESYKKIKCYKRVACVCVQKRLNMYHT